MTDPSPKVPRRERERLRHRQEILDAARQLVADRGIEGVTVEQVAKQAEFAIGSIYRHFSAKEDLILAVVGDFADSLIDEIEGVIQAPDPYPQRLRALVALSLQHQAECLPLFEAMMMLPGQFPVPGSEVATRMQEMHARLLGALEGIIVAGEAEGLLRPGARRSHTIALASLMSGYAKIAFLSGMLPEGDPVDEIVNAFLDGARVRGGAR